MGYKDQRIDVTDTEILDMIEKTGLNTDQKFSAGAMNSEFCSMLLKKVRWHILQTNELRGKTFF